MKRAPPGEHQDDPDGETGSADVSKDVAPRDSAPALQSERAYITLLFSKYRDSLYRYLTRLVQSEDAAEIVQETYFRLLRHGNTVQLESMARGYLFHTATNLVRDHKRRQRSHKADQHVELDDEELIAQSPSPDSYLAEEQVRELLERAIAALPHDTRAVFLLNRYRDLTYPEISQVMKMSTRTVARKMADAMERISAAVEPLL